MNPPSPPSPSSFLLNTTPRPSADLNEAHVSAQEAETKSWREPTQNALLWRWRNDVSVWSVFFGKLLVEPEEVAEAPPHGEVLVPEHLQRGLKTRNNGGESDWRILTVPDWNASHDALNK